MSEHGSGTARDDHATGRSSSRTLAVVSAINVVGFLVELAGGLLFGSVALLGDAFHMLFDALAYVMAFLASYVADRYGESNRWSYGLHRLEPLSAFLNGVLLFPMVGFVLWESFQRFLDPVAISTGPTLAIALGGLVVNVASVSVLGGDEMSLNERGAFYHLLGDAGGSIAVIASTAVVELTGIRMIDPITAGLIAVLIAWSAVSVVRASGAIFFLRTPIDGNAVRQELGAIDGIERVEDFHAWQICSQITVATVHVTTTATTTEASDAVIQRVHEELAAYGVDHATVEARSPDTERDASIAHTH